MLQWLHCWIYCSHHCCQAPTQTHDSSYSCHPHQEDTSWPSTLVTQNSLPSVRCTQPKLCRRSDSAQCTSQCSVAELPAKTEHLLLQTLLELPSWHLQCCCGTAGSALWIHHGTVHQASKNPVLPVLKGKGSRVNCFGWLTHTEHWATDTMLLGMPAEKAGRAIHPCAQGNLTVVSQDQFKHPRVSCCGFHSSERGQIPFFQTLPSWASF